MPSSSVRYIIISFSSVCGAGDGEMDLHGNREAAYREVPRPWEVATPSPKEGWRNWVVGPHHVYPGCSIGPAARGSWDRNAAAVGEGGRGGAALRGTPLGWIGKRAWQQAEGWGSATGAPSEGEAGPA